MALKLEENQVINAETMEIETITPPADNKQDEPTDTPEVEEEDKEQPDGNEPKDEPKDEEEEEDQPADDKPAAQKEEEEEEDDFVSVDDFLSEKYADKFNIKSEEDLDDVLGTIDEITKENETLKAEVEELKKTGSKPKFESEHEEKLFEFLKTYDLDRISEGMETYSKVVTMDLKAADPRVLLEEKFILENPELTREEALTLFKKDYKDSYTVNKENFDSEEEFKEEQKLRDIKLKKDVAKAREFLQAKQTELKAKPKQEAENTQESKPNVAIQESIKAHVSELDSYMKEFDQIIFEPSEKVEDAFHYKLSKDQLREIQEACKGWIGNPNSYDSKGKLIGETKFDVEAKVIQAAQLLFGNDMIEKALNHGLSLGKIKRVEEIAETKPNRVSKGGSGELKGTDEMSQWEEIAKKRRQRA